MAQDPNEKLEKQGNTTKGNMGEGRIKIDLLDKLLKRGKYAPKPKTKSEEEFEGLSGKNSKKKMEAAALKSALMADAMKILKSFPEPKPNSKPFQGLPMTEAIKAGRAAGRAGQVPAAQMHTMPDGKKMKGAKHGMKHGGAVKGKCKMDGIAIRGKTRAKQRSK